MHTQWDTIQSLKERVCIYTATRVILENINLSEISQTQRKGCVLDASTHEISQVTTFIMEKVKWLFRLGIMDTVSFQTIQVLEIDGEELVAQCVKVLSATGSPGRLYDGKVHVFLKMFPLSCICVCMHAIHVCGHTCAGACAYVCACVKARG